MQDGSIFLKEIVYIRLAYKSVFLDPSPSTTSMPGGGANEVDTTNEIEEDSPDEPIADVELDLGSDNVEDSVASATIGNSR
mmetsp:Transcript_23908/g.24190  ORF Transcript_23908/g.24190 Transcript_23908/m.24190 type:complete len:81 (-) Transcript_23908:111-353(-)